MEETRNKRIMVLAKSLHIITKICRIFMVLGIVCILFGIIIVPILTANIKVDTTKQTLEVFDQKMLYIMTEDKVIINDGNNSFEITKKDEVKAFNEVIDYLENKDTIKVIVAIELALVFGVSVVCLTYLAFRTIDQVFLNISSKEKIFLKENSEYMINTAKYMIAVIIVSLVASIVTGIAFDTDIRFNISLSNVITVIVLYCLAYIFEYGHELEEKSF